MNEELNSTVSNGNVIDKNRLSAMPEHLAPTEKQLANCSFYLVKIVHSHESISCFCKSDFVFKPKTFIIVFTRYGRDLGQILATIPHPPAGEELFEICREASSQDLGRYEANKAKEAQAFKICQQKIEEHKLEMKLVSTHYLLEDAKILFFFTADNRVDFRELVKDLVAVFKLRIELRQIGVRDEARVIGGLGICGRALCCHAVNDRLNPVSIKMAKEQNISLNSLKISGPCGRLLCCLGYEYECYHSIRQNLPEEGMKFLVNNEEFSISEINVLVKTIKLTSFSGRILTLPFDLFMKDEDNIWKINQELLNELNIH